MPLTYTFSSQIRSFINHACNGSTNVGVKLGVSQSSANPEEVAQEIVDRYADPTGLYNPVVDRQVSDHSKAIPLQDIKKGEEHVRNYLSSSGKSAEKWEINVAELRKVCE